MKKDPFTTVRLYKETWNLVTRIALKSRQTKARLLHNLVRSEARFWGINPDSTWEIRDGFAVWLANPDVVVDLKVLSDLQRAVSAIEKMKIGDFQSAIDLLDLAQDHTGDKEQK